VFVIDEAGMVGSKDRENSRVVAAVNDRSSTEQGKV